ncbi:MAG: response regulator [Microcystaceae cyanobacterium]
MTSFEPSNFIILVVDDLPQNVHLLLEILELAGYNSTFAQSGKEALLRLEKVKVDLILLDLMMPVMDGVELCSRIKENPEYEAIPIIFITAYPDLKSLALAFKQGAVDYIKKPFSTQELLTRIEHTLINKQATDKLKSINQEVTNILQS